MLWSMKAGEILKKDSVEKPPFMLREPQHERKILSVINANFPFALSFVEG
jgi:hypothetical protein